jgi:hypothetical protein
MRRRRHHHGRLDARTQRRGLADAVSGLEAGDSVPLRLTRRGSPLFIGLRLDD